MIEFEAGGHQYRAGKMDAMAQFHVARRLLPVVAKLGALSALPELMAARGSEEAAAKFDVNVMFGPVAEAIAGLSDADCERVINECLGVCQRAQPGGSWAPVWNKAAKRPMFDDIELPAMITIATKVLTESLSGFFAAPPSGSAALPPS